MSIQLDPCICLYGANIIHNHRQALIAEMEGVRNEADIEYIHRMRVATRRLRSSLPLFSGCFDDNIASQWRKQIRTITQALGEARDADVQIDTLNQIYAGLKENKYRPGVRRLLLRLTQRRKNMQPDINHALDHFIKSAILDDIEAHLAPLLSPENPSPENNLPLYQLAGDAMTLRLEALLSYTPIVYQPEMKEALHAMRIAAKQLRYTMEIFASIYPGELKDQVQNVRKIQEWLGNIHDCDVWLEFLPLFTDEERKRIVKFYGQPGPFNLLFPGITYFQQNRADFRNQQYYAFIQQWQQWQKQGVWDKLRYIIHKPLMPENQQAGSDAQPDYPLNQSATQPDSQPTQPVSQQLTSEVPDESSHPQ